VFLKQKETDLKREIAEVEMKALRAQINPHFIFNSLNSINNYMQKNDLQNASTYLVRFSKLIRLILENSVHHEIPLQDDLNALELYMQMEQIRLIK
jgi:LytS/YehU family sensor histidine kinase